MWMKALLDGLVFSSKSTALKENQGNVTGCLVTADEYEDVSLKHLVYVKFKIEKGLK